MTVNKKRLIKSILAGAGRKSEQVGATEEKPEQRQCKSWRKVRFYYKPSCSGFAPTLLRLLQVMLRLFQLPRCTMDILKNNKQKLGGCGQPMNDWNDAEKYFPAKKEGD